MTNAKRSVWIRCSTGAYDGGFGVVCSDHSGLTVDENRKVKSFKAEVEAYVDLPDGIKDSFDECYGLMYLSLKDRLVC